MNQPVYDSKDLRYKRPYGAVPSGTVVEFALRPDRAEGFSRATLHARFEFQENRTVTADLPGRVRLDGVDWNARCATPGDTLTPGQRCRVTELHSTLLIVEPVLTESRRA